MDLSGAFKNCLTSNREPCCCIWWTVVCICMIFFLLFDDVCFFPLYEREEERRARLLTIVLMYLVLHSFFWFRYCAGFLKYPLLRCRNVFFFSADACQLEFDLVRFRFMVVVASMRLHSPPFKSVLVQRSDGLAHYARQYALVLLGSTIGSSSIGRRSSNAQRRHLHT